MTDLLPRRESSSAFHPLIGCAGWSLRSEHADLFAGAGTHLARYASELPAVDINSSFYRPHQRKTYARWSAAVPADFRFSVKLPRTITHELRLCSAKEPLERFLEECSGLGEKLGCILVQLPPSLAYDVQSALSFFRLLRDRCDADVACEPRHRSWFTSDAEQMLRSHRIARVAADPPVVAGGDQPGGSTESQYYRLHGSPRIYYSDYKEPQLLDLTEKLRRAANEGRRVWCIFDNTPLGAATENALLVHRLLR